MICNPKLSNSSLVPGKLKEYFLKLHGDGKYKATMLAEFNVKKTRFEDRTSFSWLYTHRQTDTHSIVRSCVPDRNAVQTTHFWWNSHKNSLHWKWRKLCCEKLLKISFRFKWQYQQQNRRNEQRHLGLSSCRFDFMPSKIQSPTRRAIDVWYLTQHVIFGCYVKDDAIKEEFLFCKPLTKTRTKADDLKTLVDQFISDHDLSWNMVSAICSDEAHAHAHMLGRHSGLEHSVSTMMDMILWWGYHIDRKNLLVEISWKI